MSAIETTAATRVREANGLRLPWFAAALRPRMMALTFVAVAVLMYMPFLLHGYVLFTNTDSLFGHYPILAFGHHALRSGNLGLWNPYEFAGADFTTTMHHAFLNPIYWWLLLLPERFLFHGVTAQFLVETVLIGMVAFRIYKAVLSRRIVAFAAAVATQSCGFVWFTKTTFIGTALLLESMVTIYLLVTFSRRSVVLNYALLSVTLGLILLSGHVAYLIAFSLPALLTAMVILVRQPRPARVRFGLCVAGAGLTALLIGLVRIVPITKAVLFDQGGLVANAWIPTSPGNTAYLMLTGFIPGIWGHDFGSTASTMATLGSTGRHGQFHNMLYIGVPALAVVYLGLTGTLGRAARVGASLFAVFALTQVIGSQLVADVTDFLMWPAIHDIETRVLTAAAGAFAIVAGLDALCERRSDAPSWHVRGFLVLCAIVIAMGVTGFAKVVHQERATFPTAGSLSLVLQLLRATVLVFVGFAWWCALRMREDPATLRRLSNAALVVCWVGAAIALIVVTHFGVWMDRMVIRSAVYALGGMAWATVTLVVMRTGELSFRQVWTFAGMYGGLLLLLLLDLPDYGPGGWWAIATPAALDVLKFALLATVTAELLVGTLVVKRSRLTFLLMWTILIGGDLTFFIKNFGYSGAKPFEAIDALYPGYREMDRAKAVAKPAAPVNLVRDPNFAKLGVAEGWSGGGRAPAFKTTAGAAGETILRIANRADDYATVYQDFGPSPTRRTFGAWVRTNTPHKAGLSLRTVVFHSGSGKWEYLTSTIAMAVPVRPTLLVLGEGSAEFSLPQFFDGPRAMPSARVPSGDFIEPPVDPPTLESRARIDLRRFRMNKPWFYIGHAWGPSQANFETIYRVPSYGGVDSDIKRTLMDFLATCQTVDNTWFSRAGIKPVLANERCLDLLGVRYDFMDTEAMAERPNALARLSLFGSFEVIPDRQMALARLKAPDFDVTKTITLSEDPGWGFGDARSVRFTTPDFTSSDTSRIDVAVKTRAPSMLLFNDVFADGWKATIDNRPAKLLLANGTFMAVAVPRASTTVTLEFRPELFYSLAKISVPAGIATVLLAVGAMLTSGRRSHELRRS